MKTEIFNSNLYRELLETSITHAVRPAIIENGREISYQTLFEEVDILSAHLKETILKRNCIISPTLDTSYAFVCLLLAGIKNGYIIAPIPPEMNEVEKENAFSIISPDAVINHSKNTSHQTSEFLSSYEMELRYPLIDQAKLHELCPTGGFIRFTSGTSGSSKGVLVSENKALQRIKAAQKGFNFSPDDTFLYLMSMPYHFVTSILMFLDSGGAIILPNSDEKLELSKIEGIERTSIIYAAPFHYTSLLHSKSLSLPNLKMAISTSTNLPPQTAQSFLEKYKKPISQSYGIIEVGLPIGYSRSENDSSFQEKISSQVGKAFPDFEIAFGDESLKVNPSLNSGLLALRGPGLFDAYISPFKTSTEVLANSWFITGDYASRDEEGNISLLGRSSSVIHLAGYKIFPEEIETFLLQHPDILEAQVKGLPHEIFGSRIHANIIKSPSASINESAIIKLCKNELGRLKTPQTIDFVDIIDKTKSGKTIRYQEDPLR